MLDQKNFSADKPDTTKLEQELSSREEQSVSRVRSETETRVRELAALSEKGVSAILGDYQKEISGWRLDASNQRLLLETSFGVDLSIYYRAREQLNPFRRFADFSGSVQSSNAMRMKLFRIVFGLTPEDLIFAVIVEISQAFGKCLLASKGDVFYLIAGMDETFGAFANSPEFVAGLAVVSDKCNWYEGHMVLPFNFSGLTVDPHSPPIILVVPYRNRVHFRIRPLQADSSEFAQIVTRVKAKLPVSP
jgi:hypothetical protein